MAGDIMISKSSLIGLGAFGTSCVGLYLFEVLQSNLHISKKKIKIAPIDSNRESRRCYKCNKYGQ
jgi:hypothetical protein